MVTLPIVILVVLKGCWVWGLDSKITSAIFYYSYILISIFWQKKLNVNKRRTTHGVCLLAAVWMAFLLDAECQKYWKQRRLEFSCCYCASSWAFSPFPDSFKSSESINIFCSPIHNDTPCIHISWIQLEHLIYIKMLAEAPFLLNANQRYIIR